MPEDLPVSRRLFSTAKSFRLIKSYLNSWRYDSSTTTAVVSVTSRARLISRSSSRDPKEMRPSSSSIESVQLFPGWAVRRYVDGDRTKFDLHVHVSGFATSQRSSAGQRAVLRLAKGYAALNKLAESHNPKSTADDQAANELLQKLNDTYNQTLENAEVENSELPYDGDEPLVQSPNELGVEDRLQRWQTNLEQRIQLILSHSMLSQRAVSLELLVSHHNDTTNRGSHKRKDGLRSLQRQTVDTGPDGLFKHEFVIHWNDICHHPLAHYGYGQEIREHELVLRANLSPASGSQETNTEEQVIPITHAPIRVISDIDDTIKFSNILGGGRSIFRNVFVHDLEDITIPGMSEWYNRMWDKGVRFHYVSNGPVQLLPLVKAFLKSSNLPLGPIKLKAYRARSIFNDLLTNPGDRKRDGLDSVLKSFLDSKFILIGDSGEKDLEVYAQVAKLYPNQILAILIRDVEQDADGISDPTGKEWRKYVLSRSNSEANFPANLSRTNSLFSRFTPRGQKSRSSSVFNPSSPSTSFPPSRSATIDDSSPATSPTTPTVSEPDQMADDEDLPTARTWSPSSSPNGLHTILSASPPSVSPLSQDWDPSPIYMDKSKNISIGTSKTDKRRSAISFLEEPSLSQSPEKVSTLKAAMTGSPKASQKNITFTEGLNRTQSTSSATRQNRPLRNRVPSSDDGFSSRPFFKPRAPKRRNTTNTSSAAGSASNSVTALTSPSILSLTSKYRGVSEYERKRTELQERVWRARAEAPEHVILRIFRDPKECVEVEDVLKTT